MIEIETTAANEAVKTGNNLLVRLFGPAADGLGIQLSQGIKMRVLKNQIRGLKKVQELCDKEKINIKEVNLKVLFPYLEAIALEEEPVLEDLWANLMANYLDTEKNLGSVVYPGILKQLSTDEFKALKCFYILRLSARTNEQPPVDEREGVYKEATSYNVNNLFRLGLIKEQKVTAPENMGSVAAYIWFTAMFYEISPFGIDFYEACTR